MERKEISFELKDMDKAKRTAQVAHAAYNNIDRTDDISRKGMFTKSWNESKADIAFYLNHDDTQAPGKVIDVYETEEKAFTSVWLGNHTLGNDTLIMMDEGVIKWASFGYIAEKANHLTIKNKKVRELKEVQHLETSVLTKMPANPKAGVESVVKSLQPTFDIKALQPNEQALLKKLLMNDHDSLEQLIAMSASLDISSDLYTWICWHISRRADYIGDLRSKLYWDARERNEIKAHINTLEKFCRNTKASDATIKSILTKIEEEKSLLSQYDTADTQPITEPSVSREDEALIRIKLLTAKI
jgi:HK97 family phage prohead protease